MKNKSQSKKVLIIDRQDYWREFSAHTLKDTEFSVCVLDNYDYLSYLIQVQKEMPDLVILGCTIVGPEEQKLIKRVLENKHRLLVLATLLPQKVMRALFLAGVDDVADKPDDPDLLIRIVEQALESTSALTSYQSMERRGVI